MPGPKLSKEQAQQFSSCMVQNGTPVRFLYRGQCLDIATGNLQDKGINIIYQRHYWNFTPYTAREIEKVLGADVHAILSEPAPRVESEIAWYEVRSTDYYGEFFELVPTGFTGQWPQQFPKLEVPALFSEEGAQLFVEWPKETVLETVVAINGETSVKVDMFAPADRVKTQKLFVPIERYGHKIMVRLPKGTRLRVG